jgi:serine/threonine-protein kinase
MRLNRNDIKHLLVGFDIDEKELAGGQRTVFKCSKDGCCYAAKFMVVPSQEGFNEYEQDDFDELIARCRRELLIMNSCTSPNIVNIPSLDLYQGKIPSGETVIYYFEEWIDGVPLSTLIAEGYLSERDIISLGLDISYAIEDIWNQNCVHRDIKPANIIKRNSDRAFVLLDLGFAYNLLADSLSKLGAMPGTIMYFSPEQFDYRAKRKMDFRSDLFSLGTTMFEAATGMHPFWTRTMREDEVCERIARCNPVIPLDKAQSNLSSETESIIMRMIQPFPNARYRKIEQFREALQSVSCRKDG